MCALYVHREQQESLAHADREDQRLVLVSRPLLVYRWQSWHLSEQKGSARACSKGNPHDSTVKHFQVTDISENPFCDFNQLVFFSRALVEREDQEDQQEKLDQRCGKHLTTTGLHM